jgi:hypothetical protein
MSTVKVLVAGANMAIDLRLRAALERIDEANAAARAEGAPRKRLDARLASVIEDEDNQGGSMEKAIALIEELGADPRARDSVGRNAMALAVASLNWEVFDALAPVCGDADGGSALLTLVENGYGMSIGGRLAAAAAISDPQAANAKGRNALMCAAQKGDSDAVSKLLAALPEEAAKKMAERQDGDGSTAFLLFAKALAQRSGHQMFTLFDHNALGALAKISDPLAVDHEGRNALHLAAQNVSSLTSINALRRVVPTQALEEKCAKGKTPRGSLKSSPAPLIWWQTRLALTPEGSEDERESLGEVFKLAVANVLWEIVALTARRMDDDLLAEAMQDGKMLETSRQALRIELPELFARHERTEIKVSVGINKKKKTKKSPRI